MPANTRNSILRLLLLLSCGVALAAERPNVVLLISDDQGWTDYGFMGHPHIRTPNIDRLAAAGMVYERGYVASPLCRPSLASLVTGHHPHQTGIRGNDPVGWRQTKDPKTRAAARNRMTAPMAGLPSFVQELQAHGYATLQTGKWWEGNPLNHGFDRAMTHGDPLKGGRHGDKGLAIGRSTMQPIRDFVDQATSEGKPFFIWYGVFLPHAPHNAPDRIYEKYRDAAPNEPTARYWANCEWLDETCGQLVDILKEKDAYSNTLFIYTCDNGWRQDPERRNRDDNHSKRHPTEIGIRTPVILIHPGKITPSRDKKTLVSNIDIAPTILKACGIKVPPQMKGLDLRDKPALRKRNRVFVEVYEHDSDIDRLDDIDNGLVARVVIDGWNKLVKRPDSTELYNLRHDPDDRNDLHAKHPETTARLGKLLRDWLDQNN